MKSWDFVNSFSTKIKGYLLLMSPHSPQGLSVPSLKPLSSWCLSLHLLLVTWFYFLFPYDMPCLLQLKWVFHSADYDSCFVRTHRALSTCKVFSPCLQPCLLLASRSLPSAILPVLSHRTPASCKEGLILPLHSSFCEHTFPSVWSALLLPVANSPPQQSGSVPP